MTAPVVRRLRLPPAPSSPAVARAAVAEALAAGGLGALVDETLLLTTELVTNGVVHAGTDLELEITTDRRSVTVLVLDHRRELLTLSSRTAARSEAARSEPAMRVAARAEPVRAGTLARTAHPGDMPGTARPGDIPGTARSDDLTEAGRIEELAERGRGLLLVDHLASSWGTLQHGTGKGVWFRLELPPADGQPPDLGGAALLPPAARQRTVPVGGLPVATPGPDSRYSGLLHRLCDATGATAAAVLVDQADGRGPVIVAAVGQPAPDADELRIPLGLSRPLRGELVVTAPGTGYAVPLAELAADHVTLLLENDRLRQVDAERRAWLTFLAEASELLAQSLDVELTLALVPRIAVPRLGSWCAVHTVGADGQLHRVAATHADEDQVTDLIDRLRLAMAQLTDALHADGGVLLPAPLDGYTVPLVARGQPFGTLTLGRGLTAGWPGAEETAVIEDIARRAAVAIDNARIHADRRDVAHQLQRSLLPPVLPQVVGVEFGAEYVPAGAGGDAGGDFYDVMAVSDDSWLVVVGDVSGKGVQAAAVTGLVRDVIRVLVRDGRPLPDALARLNETLVERGGGRFCTLALAAVTRQPGGELDIGLYLAGHDQPILVHGDGTAGLVGRCGTALGLLETIASPQSNLRLHPGESLVFYTDGVTERRRGEDLFGQVRLCHEAALLAGYPAATVAARLRASTLGFSAETPRDDIAIFVIRNDGPVDPTDAPRR